MARKPANPLESYIEKKVVAYAKSKGIGSLKLNVQGRRNEPDRIFFVPGGKPLLIEFKRQGMYPRPGQQKRIEELVDLGYALIVCSSVAAGKLWIDVHANGR